MRGGKMTNCTLCLNLQYTDEVLLLFYIIKNVFVSCVAVGPVIMSIEEKMEADGRSIYVGNVSNTVSLVLWLCFNLSRVFLFFTFNENKSCFISF